MIRTLAAALATSTCIVALATPAAAQTREYNIPAGSLKSALDAYVRQSGRQVVYRADQVRSARSPGTRGQQSADAALAAILAGSGFTTRVDGNLVAIVREGNGQSAAEASPSMRLDDRSDEIVVTGTNIRGPADQSTPRFAITRDDFQKTGFSTVEDIIESIPQNFNAINSTGARSFSAGVVVANNTTTRASGIDLRGLGPGSTLTLLDGQRRAGANFGQTTDVSAIPLAAIERVDVVTGGSSSIYGSDAVAGVVNFITRKKFAGAETSLYIGDSVHDGGQGVQASQLVGWQGARGGIVGAYEFVRETMLDFVDTGIVREGASSQILTASLRPYVRRHSGYIAGDYQLTDGIQTSLEILYSRKNQNTAERTYFPNFGFGINLSTRAISTQYSVISKTIVDLSDTWQFNVTGNLGKALDDQSDFYQFPGLGEADSEVRRQIGSRLLAGSAIAEGTLFLIENRPVKLAVGGEYRSEKFTFQLIPEVAETTYGGQREIASAFIEARVPITDAIDLSAAGRFDHYSDFGDVFVFSGGGVWRPVEGLSLRATFGKNFRAPDLAYSRPNDVIAGLRSYQDPLLGGALIPALLYGGSNTALTAEKAKNWTVGFDYQPDFIPSLRLSASYFNIGYTDRIDLINTSDPTLLQQEQAGLIPGIVNRNPTNAQIQAIRDTLVTPITPDPLGGVAIPPGFDVASGDLLSAFPNLIIVDSRIQNLAREHVDGIDVQLAGRFDTDIGQMHLGANVNYTFNHKRALTVSSPYQDLLNEPGKPVDFRFSANAGWSRGPFDVNLTMRYADSYPNNVLMPFGTVPAWTTFDLSVRFDGSRSGFTGWVRGFSAVLAADNLFNQRPPRAPDGSNAISYDSANADPRGRFLSLRLTQRWGGTRTD